jgi:hypothetical protein
VTGKGRVRGLRDFNEHIGCCSVLEFEEDGCKVYLPTRRRGWICLSGDKYSESHGHKAKLADLLFAWKVDNNELLSCVLELKSGTISVSGVVGQLQQAALIVDQLLSGTTIHFLPVLVHGAIPTVTLRKLKNQTINFRGAKMRIHRINCGSAVEGLKWSLAVRRR